MEFWIKIRSKINLKKLAYPAILILFFAAVGVLFTLTAIFLSTRINESISPDQDRVNSGLIKIDMASYGSAVKKLRFSSRDETNLGNSLQRDAMRINKIAEIKKSLQLYAADNSGTYPTNLSELAPLYIDKLPTDPSNYNNFSYSFYPADYPVKYHLGASMETMSEVLESDADLDTRTSPGGFSGDDKKKCKTEDFGNYCFDVINP